MSKIALETSLRMFERASVDRDRMMRAVRLMGATHLKNAQMRREYDADNPLRNYCYVVAEATYAFKAPPGSTSYKLAVPGYDTWHRYWRMPDGDLIDLAAEQFPDYALVVYANEQRCGFQSPSPSYRARLLARLMGWLPDTPEPRLAAVNPDWALPSYGQPVPSVVGK